MKKSISAILVAALMLFAFTACEQPANIWNPNGKDVVEVTIASGDTDYLVNQAFDASRYTLDILYKDGTTAQKNGNGILQMDPAMNLLAGAKTIDVTLGGYNGSLVVNYYNVDSISIETAPSKTTYDTDDTQGDISLDGISVVASYNGGKTVELKDTEYAITKVAGAAYTAATKLTETAEGETTAVTVAYKTGDATYGAEAEFGITVAKAPETPVLADVTEIISAELKEEVFAGATTVNDVKNADNWTIIGRTANGAYTVTSSDTSSVAFDCADSMATAGAYKVKVTLTVGSGKTVSTVVTINVLEDLTNPRAVSALTITSTATEDVELSPEQFTNYVMATNAAGQEVKTGFRVVSINEDFIPRNETSANVEVTFTWAGNNNSKEYKATVTVNVTR